MIAVCTLGCTRKRNDIHSWDTLVKLQGDYELYINWEIQNLEAAGDDVDYLTKVSTSLSFAEGATIDQTKIFVDQWNWSHHWNNWRGKPKFDQDQARLSSIVAARSMCIEFAMQRGASHLLFIDADIVPPLDIIPKLLEVDEDAVCGLVYGRGAHSACPYIFQEKREYIDINGIRLKEVEHANIGFTMLSRRLFNQVRFRYGHTEYPDGSARMVSDDPAYHLDAFIKFGRWPVVRMDCVGKHVGDLSADQVSQF